MPAVVSPVAYGSSVALAAAIGVALCLAARLRPGRWRVTAARAVGVVLAGTAISFVVSPILRGDWTLAGSLPLALCNMALLIAIAACWWQIPLLVELTWFWGLAGTLQAVITPDLTVGFPHAVFFEYVIGHTAIVVAACFLVLGMRITPRPGAIWRVFTITCGYTALVGLFDAFTGSDYMFLRHPPANWTLLRLLGPWPWYIVSATGVALVLLALLDAPFWRQRRRAGGRTAVATTSRS